MLRDLVVGGAWPSNDAQERPQSGCGGLRLTRCCGWQRSATQSGWARARPHGALELPQSVRGKSNEALVLPRNRYGLPS